MRLRQRGLHMRTYWTFHLWPLKQDSLDICMVAFNTQESFFSSLEMQRNLAQVNSAGSRSIGLRMRIYFWSYSNNNRCNRKLRSGNIRMLFSYRFSSTPSVVVRGVSMYYLGAMWNSQLVKVLLSPFAPLSFIVGPFISNLWPFDPSIQSLVFEFHGCSACL